MKRKFDVVITVAIGRKYGRNKVLTNGRWRNFQKKTKNLVSTYATVVAVTHGHGICSDGNRKNKGENTFVVLAVNPIKVKKLRTSFVGLLRQYNQTSLAFASDKKHVPVFDKK